MAKIVKLEDLVTWKKARRFANKIYVLTEKFPKEEKYNIVKHLRESARSVMACIAEGFGRFHFKDSAIFYSDARGSLQEIKSDLYLSFDRKYIANEELEEYLKDLEELNRLINGLMNSSYSSFEKWNKRE